METETTFRAVFHSCGGRDHLAALPVRRVVRLGCGCDRYEMTRCDGTGVHDFSGCSIHRYGAA